MKKRMSRASASGAVHALIIGDDELARGKAQLKHLGSGEQRSVPFQELVGALKA
jgi:histidyl-tRNA synthetase